MDAIQTSGRGHSHPMPNRQEMLKKFDTNGDGKIDDAEKKAGFEKMRAHHHRPRAEKQEVADSNREAVQSAGPAQYTAEGQAAAPAPDQPTLDVTV